MTHRSENVVPITSRAKRAAQEFGAAHDRELLTILFTDLVDSTKLQSEAGNVEAARLTELHRTIVRDELAQYDAREIEWAGDSCLAVFSKPSDAVVFALRMQAEHRRVRETEPKLPLVRLGMHLGEVVVKHGQKKDDLFGLQVSEAARVMSVARGNQIFCTRAVFDSARGSLKGEVIEGVGETLWARHGLYLLKGSEDPVEICEIGDSAVTLPFPPEPNEKCRPLTSDRHGPGWRSIAAISILLIVVGVGAWWFGRAGSPRDTTEADARRSPAEPLPVRRYTERLPAGQSIIDFQPVDTPLALSPDGSMLVYVGAIPNEPALILRRRNELEGTVLPGTQRGTRPAFSPDGRWIVFTGYEQDTRKLMKISVDGETVVPLADAPISFPAVWSEDGYIYYTPRIGSGLMRVPETGGEPETVTSLEGTEMSHSYPRLIAGRNAIGFASFSEASIDSASMNVVDLDTGERKILLEKSGPGPYLPTGHILVIQKERLMAARFDVQRLEFAGPLFDVTESAMAAAEAPPSQFTIAHDGTLVYVPQEINGDDSREAVWYQDGVESRLPLPFGSFQDLVLSSDGRYILLKTRPPGVNDMWMYDRERQNTTRLTHTASWELGGIFGPRDEFVYFVGNHDTAWAIYRLPINDPDRIQTVISTDFADAYVTDITNDGRALIVSHRGTAVDYDISILHLHENAEPEWQSLFTGDYTERGGVLSPDEKWIAYESNESGRYEVYVQAFPELGNKVKVSVDGGVNHRWSHDGDTLFYRHPGDGPFYRVRLTYDPRLAPGLAEKFLEGDGYLYPWDVAPDGSGFVLAKRRRGARQGPGVDEIVVVENWFEEIRRLEPRQTN